MQDASRGCLFYVARITRASKHTHAGEWIKYNALCAAIQPFVLLPGVLVWGWREGFLVNAGKVGWGRGRVDC